MNTPAIPGIAGQFQQTFSRAPVGIARAPGRIEFIGNHPDYNGGAVLGAAINCWAWAAAAPNPADRLRLFSVSGPAELKLPSDPGTKVTAVHAGCRGPVFSRACRSRPACTSGFSAPAKSKR